MDRPKPQAGETATDAACLRGRGWTLYQAVTGLHDWGTNPGMSRQASHALAQVLAGP